MLPEFLFKKFEKIEGFDKIRNKVHFGVEELKGKKVLQNNVLESDEVVIGDRILEFLNNL